MIARTTLVALVTAVAALTALPGCSVTRGQSSVGEYIDDSAITAQVKAKFVESKSVDAAAISVDPELCASFTMEGKIPRSVIIVTAESVYTQCPKALVRSHLWDADRHLPESALPSSGVMLKAAQADFDAEAYDRNYPQRLKETGVEVSPRDQTALVQLVHGAGPGLPPLVVVHPVGGVDQHMVRFTHALVAPYGRERVE